MEIPDEIKDILTVYVGVSCGFSFIHYGFLPFGIIALFLIIIFWDLFSSDNGDFIG